MGRAARGLADRCTYPWVPQAPAAGCRWMRGSRRLACLVAGACRAQRGCSDVAGCTWATWRRKLGRRLARRKAEQGAQTPLLVGRGRGFWTVCRSAARLTPACRGHGQGEVFRETAALGLGRQLLTERRGGRIFPAIFTGRRKQRLGRVPDFWRASCTREGCLSLKRKRRGSHRPGGALPPSLGREAGRRGRASSALGAPSRAGVDGPP